MRATECLNKGLSLSTTARNKYRCPPRAPGPGLYAVAVYDGFRVNESPPQSSFFQYVLVLTQPLKLEAIDLELRVDNAPDSAFQTASFTISTRCPWLQTSLKIDNIFDWGL
jgi:hypothetical protein